MHLDRKRALVMCANARMYSPYSYSGSPTRWMLMFLIKWTNKKNARHQFIPFDVPVTKWILPFERNVCEGYDFGRVRISNLWLSFDYVYACAGVIHRNADQIMHVHIYLISSKRMRRAQTIWRSSRYEFKATTWMLIHNRNRLLRCQCPTRWIYCGLKQFRKLLPSLGGIPSHQLDICNILFLSVYSHQLNSTKIFN